MRLPHTIILASTSVHRRQLLERLALPFTQQAPDVDERLEPGEAPGQRAMRLAVAKAAAVAAQHPEAIVIGSDQVASLDRDAGVAQILRKPGDRATCAAQLDAMSGRKVSFDTAVCVQAGNVVLTHLEPTVVSLRDLTAAAIDHYIDREPSFDCAGGFRCEGLGVTLFQSVESRDPTALVGLPLIWLCEALRQLGVEV
jgi:septum formation protein